MGIMTATLDTLSCHDRRLSITGLLSLVTYGTHRAMELLSWRAQEFRVTDFSYSVLEGSAGSHHAEQTEPASSRQRPLEWSSSMERVG